MKLQKKPWNQDDRTCPAYRVYLFGEKCRYVSWRRLKKAAAKLDDGKRGTGRIEKHVIRVCAPSDPMGAYYGYNI